MENDSSFEKQGLYHQAESSSPIKSPEPSRYAFKIIRLNPGISPLNFVCCLINAIISVFAVIIPSMLQPLILVDKDSFNISQNHAGSVTSLALFVDLIIKVLVLVPYGHCSDKLGRKVIIYYGAATYLLGCAIMATQTTIFPGLVFAKILLANAAASFQAVPLLADYTSDESKGRASGLLIMFVGLTTVVGNLYIKLLLHENLSLGRCYLITGMVVTLVLILSSFGLKKGRYHAPVSTSSDELPPTAADLNSLEPSNSNVISTRNCMSILRKFKDAAKIFKEREWLQISLILQVAANSTQFVFFSYLALYVKSMFPDGTDDNTSNIAVNNIQTYTFIPTFFVVAAYGYLLDKPGKALKLAFLGIGGLATAFILIILSTSPDNLTLIFSALFIGAFMPGLFVLSNYLSIKNCPADKRGVMGGFIEMAANTSYFLISSLEGLLYDNWIKRGPFILDISLLGLAVLLILIIYKRNIASKVDSM